MNPLLILAAETHARREGWVLTGLLVLGLALLFVLLFGVLRRVLLKPLRREPSDTTDAWTEAGRRLRVPPEGGDRSTSESGADEEPS